MSIGDLLTAAGIGTVAIYAFLRGQATATTVTKGLTELRVALIGLDGKNGMRSEIRAVDEKVSDLAVRVNQHHDKIAALAAKQAPKRRRAA